jgi:hypothetical protein
MGCDAVLLLWKGRNQLRAAVNLSNSRSIDFGRPEVDLIELGWCHWS